MRRSQLPILLKKIHPGLQVVRHSNRGEHIYHGGLDAVFLYNQFVCAVPPGNMYMKGNLLYRNSKYHHRSLIGLVNRLKAKGVLYGHKIQGAIRDTTSY